MAKDKSPHVAVLVDTSTGWGRRLIRGVIRYSDKHGPWHLTVQPCGQADYLPLPHGWAGHGVIARIGSLRMVRALTATRLPVINVSAIDLPDNPFPQIITDYHEQANLAVQHFRDRGFCHFAYSGLHAPVMADDIATRFATQFKRPDFIVMCLSPRGLPRIAKDLPTSSNKRSSG